MRHRFFKKYIKDQLCQILRNVTQTQGEKRKDMSIKAGTNKCFLNAPDSKYFRITGDTFSVTDTVFCHCSVEAATDNMKMNRQSHGANKLFTSPQTVTLPIPGVQIMTIYTNRSVYKVQKLTQSR